MKTALGNKNIDWLLGSKKGRKKGHKNMDVNRRVKIRISDSQKRRAVKEMQILANRFDMDFTDVFPTELLSDGRPKLDKTYIRHRENLRRFCILLGEFKKIFTI